MAAGQQLGERGGEEDRHRAGHGCRFVKEQVADGFGLDGSAAERDDGLVVLVGRILLHRVKDAGDGFGFEAAEVFFAVMGEDAGDREAVLRGDEGVDVEKGPVQACREEAAHGGLAGAHEAGEDDTTGQRSGRRGG